MSISSAHAAIRAHFDTRWAAAFAPDAPPPAALPNLKFDIPNSGSWVRLNIDPANAFWASFGDPDNNTRRTVGQVTVQIFTPSGEGEGLALEYADLLRDVFDNFEDASSSLRFLEPPFARKIGVDGKWFQMNVVAPYQHDDFT